MASLVPMDDSPTGYGVDENGDGVPERAASLQDIMRFMQPTQEEQPTGGAGQGSAGGWGWYPPSLNPIDDDDDDDDGPVVRQDPQTGRWFYRDIYGEWHPLAVPTGGGGAAPNLIVQKQGDDIVIIDPTTGQEINRIPGPEVETPPEPFALPDGGIGALVPDETSEIGWRVVTLVPGDEAQGEYLGRAGDSVMMLQPDGTIEFIPIPSEYLIAEAPTPVEMASRMMEAGETDLGVIQTEVEKRFGTEEAAGTRPMTEAERKKAAQSRGLTFLPGGPGPVRPTYPGATPTRTYSEYGEFMAPYRMADAAVQALQAGTLDPESGMGRAVRGLSPTTPEEGETPYRRPPTQMEQGLQEAHTAARRKRKKRGSGLTEAAKGAVVGGPAVALVGDRLGANSPSAEYLLAPPGTVIAPKPPGEEATMANALKALLNQRRRAGAP